MLPDWVLPIKRYAKELHEREKDLYVGHWKDFKEASKNRTAKPCTGNALLRAQEKHGFSDELAGYTSGSFHEAGSDTTSATLIGCAYS